MRRRLCGLTLAAALAAAGVVAPGAGARLVFTAPGAAAPGHALNAVACPTASSCVAVGDAGQAASSTDLGDPAPVWAAADVDGHEQLTGVSCPAADRCLAVDGSGHALASSRPAGDAAAWHLTQIDAGHHLNAVACPRTTLCVAVDRAGGVLSSTSPFGPRPRWHRVALRRSLSDLQSVACPSSRMCVASTAAQSIVAATRPTGSAGAWRAVRAIGGPRYRGNPVPHMDSLSCPSSSRCLIAAADGLDSIYVLTTTSPTAARVWRYATSFGSGEPYTNVSRGAVACGAADSCVADFEDQFGNWGVVSASSTSLRWADASIPGVSYAGAPPIPAVRAITCHERALCVLVTGDGRAIVARG